MAWIRLKVVGVSSSRFLPLLVADLTSFGRVPLAEIDLDALGFQPALEQVNLRGLARAVEALDGDQPARKIQFGKRFHEFAKLRFSNLMKLSIATSPSSYAFICPLIVNPTSATGARF